MTRVIVGGAPRWRSARSLCARSPSAEDAGGVTFSPIRNSFRLQRFCGDGTDLRVQQKVTGVMEFCRWRANLKGSFQDFAGTAEYFALVLGYNEKLKSAAQAF